MPTPLPYPTSPYWSLVYPSARLGNPEATATWAGVPFYGCAYLDSEEVPAWALEMWTHSDEIKPGHWLETRWLEEWKEFHLLLQNSAQNKLASFLSRLWEIFDLDYRWKN